ncbi:RidA family protein [bacterium]|nr:RidA family protein [candidate division CSSED10-310 bacterium]
MNRQIITTDSAPAAIGPYSQAIRAGNFLFISGQLPMHPVSGKIVTGGIDAQSRQVLKNIAGILQAASLTPEHVVKATIFLKDLQDFSTVNAIYGEMFTHQPPARECVEVARLPRDAAIEISVIAICA